MKGGLSKERKRERERDEEEKKQQRLCTAFLKVLLWQRPSEGEALAAGMQAAAAASFQSPASPSQRLEPRGGGGRVGAAQGLGWRWEGGAARRGTALPNGRAQRTAARARDRAGRGGQSSREERQRGRLMELLIGGGRGGSGRERKGRSSGNIFRD